jgi:hypothetical protein
MVPYRSLVLDPRMEKPLGTLKFVRPIAPSRSSKLPSGRLAEELEGIK